jgi:hypothetical protein
MWLPMISRNNDCRLIFSRARACQVNYPVGKGYNLWKISVVFGINKIVGDNFAHGIFESRHQRTLCQLASGEQVALENYADATQGSLDCQLGGIEANTAQIINRVGGPLSVWRIAPPLTITKSEVDQALEIMDEAFASV